MTQPWIVVHGRFQPFHLGHLEYLSLAMARGSRVVVGITNPCLGSLVPEAASGHRHHPDANPYTYFDRAEMVTASAAEAPTYRDHHVRVVPFDVSDPGVWDDYLPRDAVHLVTVNEPWDEEKVRRFTAVGLAVEAIPGNPARVTATEVRRRLATAADWRALVPRGTAQVIDQMRASHRPLLPTSHGEC
ncbi:adenylyltransferase/cytidyltransferase family protein [Streptomyces sp. NPDC001492]